jgi:hypothetical protein
MKLPKLHLRDLFWLVLVVGLGCAWWVDRQRIADKERRLDEAIESNARLQSELVERRQWLADHISSLKP